MSPGISAAAADTLSNVAIAASLASTLITAAAVLAGGVWAYFKFARGRTFKPRVEFEAAGTWCVINGRNFLKCSIRLKNIGLSKLPMIDEKVIARICKLDQSDLKSVPGLVMWKEIGNPHILFKEAEVEGDDLQPHSWLEPGEFVLDELLFDWGTSEPCPIMIELRASIKHWVSHEVVSDRYIILPESVLTVKSGNTLIDSEKPIDG